MRHNRSIRYRLITLYVCLLALVFVCFGAYTYWGFQKFLIASLEKTLLRRAQQIASTILEELPSKGKSYVANEIQMRYAPELNERVIRITDANGQLIYASPNATLLTTTPSPSIPDATSNARPVYLEESSGKDELLRVVVVSHRLANGNVYSIEVGAPETDITTALHSLILTLMLGFPMLIGVAILGGYSLLGKALRPVDEIVGAAERITYKNLNERLPVPQTGDEFEHISQALNRMIERLDEAFQIANRFSADASHELRTPLTIIQGELEVLANDPSLTPEKVERVGDILEEVERLSHIVEGLLLVSRLEAGEAQMKWSVVNFGELVSSTAEQMELLSTDKLLKLKTEIGPQTMVEGDEIRLRQVVVNLLDNAIKYTPEGGSILLKVYSSANLAFFEITDTGIGISSTAMPHVFNRFFRAEEAKAGRVQGSGLGLTIVQSITEAHRGHVYVESNATGGTKFRIELPLLQSMMPEQKAGAHLVA
jgi:heavy metal sensor kinase